MDMPVDVQTTDVSAALAKPIAAYHAAPECNYLSNAQAQAAFTRLKAMLPSTAFDNARPSEICGLVRVQLASGTVVYTEPTGRYLLLTFALDTHKGSPADIDTELQEQVEFRQTFPESPIPGIIPGVQPSN